MTQPIKLWVVLDDKGRIVLDDMGHLGVFAVKHAAQRLAKQVTASGDAVCKAFPASLDVLGPK